MRPVVFGAVMVAAASLAGSARAEETSVRLQIKDHALVPAKLSVAHGTRFELVVTNAGPGAEEIESKGLRLEKIIPEGQSVTIRLEFVKPFAKVRFHGDQIRNSSSHGHEKSRRFQRYLCQRSGGIKSRAECQLCKREW